MKSFKLKMEFEGRTLIKKEGDNICDFDEVMDGLKQKFDGIKKNKRV